MILFPTCNDIEGKQFFNSSSSVAEGSIITELEILDSVVVEEDWVLEDWVLFLRPYKFLKWQRRSAL